MTKPRLAFRKHNSFSWRWSKAEDLFLKQKSGKKSTEDIAGFLRRSKTEVRYRFKFLGLSSAFHVHAPRDASDIIGTKFGDWQVIGIGSLIKVGETYHTSVVCKNLKYPQIKNRLWQASRIRKGKVAGKTCGIGHITGQGYRRIIIKGKCWAEHRYVVDQALRKQGLRLTKRMSIHHRNGIRSDNRLKNLQIKPFKHGKGQDVLDYVRHLRELGCRVFIPKKVVALC